VFTLFAIAMADTAAQKSVKNVHVLGKLEIELNTNIPRIFFFLAFAVDYRK